MTLTTEEETCLSRTWTLEALKGLTLSHRKTVTHMKKKKDFLTYLSSQYSSLSCLEHGLTCGKHCVPLCHRSAVDEQRLNRHRTLKIHLDYFRGCFLTERDATTCLALAKTTVPLSEDQSLDQLIALPCYVTTKCPAAFGPPTNVLGEALDSGPETVPLGIIVSQEKLIGILTTTGILRLRCSPSQTTPPNLPTLEASPALATSLLLENDDDDDSYLPADQVDHVLGLIRPNGTLVTDRGGKSIAVLWWWKKQLESPLFVDLADFLLSDDPPQK
jgi:hypothetical protein